MNRRHKYFIIILLLLLFFPISQVKGYSNISSQLPASGSNCRPEGCWPFLAGSDKAVRGMRLTLMYTTGKTVAGTSGYNVIRVTNDIQKLSQYGGYYYWNSQCNKVQVTKGTCKLGNPTLKTKEGMPYALFSAAQTQKYFNAWPNVKLDALMLDNNLAGIWNTIKGSKQDTDHNAYIKLIGALFFNNESTDPSKAWTKNFSNDEISNMWILIEPLTLIRYNSKEYFGTFNELASVDYVGMQKTPLSTFIDYTIPCSAYITKDQIAPFINAGAPGVVDNGYFSKTGSPGSAQLVVVPDGVCSSKNNRPSYNGYRYGNSGVGIGVVYVPDLIPIATNCAEVEKNYKGANLSGISATNLAKLPATLTYIKDGKTVSVPREWYKNDCTCYGVTDYYQSNHKSNLGDLPLNNIKNIFDSNKATFDSFLKITNNLVTKNTAKFSSELWTYAKYVNLKCPYKAGGSTSTQKKYNCTPKFGIGSCETGNNTYYSDFNNKNGLTEEQFWDNCVFDNKDAYYNINTHKTPDKDSPNTYYEKNLGSQYCEVYCTEEIVTNFDSRTITVPAGGNFTWNDHSITGSRTCRTKDVDWDQYDEDMVGANKNVEAMYVYREINKLKQQSINNATVQKNNSSCSCINNTSNNTCCRRDNPTYHSRTCTGKYIIGFICIGPTICIPKYTTYKYDCSYWTYPCGQRDYTRYDLYTAKGVSFSLTDGYKTSGNWPGTTWCSNQSKPTVDSTANSKYNQALSDASGLTNAMKKCSSWNNSIIYNLNPSADASFQAGQYSYNDILNKGSGNSSSYIDSDCLNTTVLNYTNCTGTKCTSTGSMNKCSYYEKTVSDTAKFSLPSGLYQYILKENNLSFSSWDLDDYIDQNYINIGYSNFPIPYAMPDGVYKDLSLNYYKIGHMIGGSTIVDRILGSTDVNKNGDFNNWNCEYNVNSKLIPDTDNPNVPGTGGGTNNSGINLIYRPIDLNNPFPDIDANGRTTGYNWCYFSDCSNKNKYVNDFILNNRGVKGEDIYYDEPMYTFTLTPVTINSIREYNKEHSYTDYEEFKCNTGTGQACISAYLTKLIGLTNASNLPGSCVSDLTRNYRDINAFENCRKLK